MQFKCLQIFLAQMVISINIAKCKTTFFFSALMVIFLTKTTYFCGSVFFPVSCEIESHIFRFGYQSQCFVKSDSYFLSNCYQSIKICVVFFRDNTHNSNYRELEKYFHEKRTLLVLC